MDAVLAPVWATVNAFLIWAGWLTARRLIPGANPFLRVSQIILFWWACVVLAGVSLGAPGILTGSRLLAAGSVWGAVFLGLSSVAVGGAGAVASVRSLCTPARWSGHGIWLPLWGAWLAWMLGRIAAGGLLEFPNDWDTLMYHLPLVDQWLREGSLYAPNEAVWYNAANSELVALWMVAPFSGDFLFALNNFPALLLVAAAAVELGGELNLGRTARHLAAVAVTSNMVVFRQALDAKNDLAVLALLLVTCTFWLRYIRSGRPGDLPYAATGFGLLCGVKYYALGYAGMMWVVMAGLCWVVRGRRTAVILSAAGLIGGSLLAGYWYARNYWVKGTPLYPLGVSPGTDVIHTAEPRIWESTFLGNGSPDVLPLLIESVRSMTGPCHVAGFLLSPALVAWLCVSAVWVWRSQDQSAGGPRLALAGLITGSCLVLGITPYGVETTPGTMNMLREHYLPVRFGLCFLSLCVFGVAVLAQDVSEGVRRLGSLSWLRGGADLPLILFGLAVAYQFLVSSTRAMKGNTLDSVLIGVNLLILFFIAQLACFIFPTVAKKCLIASYCVALGPLSWSIHAHGRQWHSTFSAYYDRIYISKMFRSFERVNPVDPAEVRIFVLEPRYYPFFGSRRQFAVCRPSFLLSRGEALRRIYEFRATIVITPREPILQREDDRYDHRGDWYKDYPDVFHPLQGTGWDDGYYFRAWQVDQDALRRLVLSA